MSYWESGKGYYITALQNNDSKKASEGLVFQLNSTEHTYTKLYSTYVLLWLLLLKNNGDSFNSIPPGELPICALVLIISAVFSLMSVPATCL